MEAGRCWDGGGVMTIGTPKKKDAIRLLFVALAVGAGFCLAAEGLGAEEEGLMSEN